MCLFTFYLLLGTLLAPLGVHWETISCYYRVFIEVYLWKVWYYRVFIAVGPLLGTLWRSLWDSWGVFSGSFGCLWAPLGHLLADVVHFLTLLMHLCDLWVLCMHPWQEHTHTHTHTHRYTHRHIHTCTHTRTALEKTMKQFGIECSTSLSPWCHSALK